jgi:hypothetical protein
MSVDDATGKSTADESLTDQDARDRKSAADSLRRQIENLKTGRPPRSLNEFVEEKMAEDRKRDGS